MNSIGIRRVWACSGRKSELDSTTLRRRLPIFLGRAESSSRASTSIGGVPMTIGKVSTSIGETSISIGKVSTSIGNGTSLSIGEVSTYMGEVSVSIGEVQSISMDGKGHLISSALGMVSQIGGEYPELLLTPCQ